MSEQPFTRATRRAALESLRRFLPRAGAVYASERNFDRGPDERNNVSLLSPYLRHRLIAETEVLDAVLQCHGSSAASRFIDQIFWRAYFKGWLEHHPTVWSDYRAAVSSLIDTLETNSDLRKRYEAALNAATGIDCFDAWVTELVNTGYLHNHARMWFASIWVYTLGLPWQLGADFFYRHLVDGDPASNTLGWRWICGLHTQGKSYLARPSNIARYTSFRFVPDGRLAGEAPPMTDSQTHPLRTLPDAQATPADLRYGLLVTEEDCNPQTLPLDCAPVAVMGATTTESRSPLPVGIPARIFATGAVANGTLRAARHFRVPSQRVMDDDWDDALVAWASANGLDAIVTAYAPAGPVAEKLTRCRRTLAAHGVELLQPRRAYDSCTWQHASGGYFRMKPRIPDILEQLGLDADDRDVRHASA